MKANYAAVLAAVCVSLPGGAALAQSASTGQSSGTGLTMPYERNFWGHAGLSLGRSELGASCPGGLACDNRDTVWRLYGGGRFNNAIGGEVGYVNFGDFSRAGGETDAHGLDFTLVAGIPFGSNQNWSIFGKLGTVYTWSDVSGVAPLRTGDAEGFSPRFGVGLQMGITPNWSVRADIDRYRVRLPEGREDVDTFLLGAQYTFRP
jgi:hypothetical protein